MSVWEEILKNGLAEIGVNINEEQLRCFQIYCAMLLEAGKRMNITSIVKEEDIAEKHFIDSLTCFKAVDIDDGMCLLDVGTGAGFPGIPIKICRPGINVILIESQMKKVNFLLDVIKGLKLRNISVVHARAEDAGRNFNYRESGDIVVARAVAGLAVLAEYCLPLAKVRGVFLAMKGPKLDEEMIKANKAIEVLGGRVIKKVNLKLPVSGEERNLVVIEKYKQTPGKYPRRSGMPLKKPIQADCRTV